MNSEEEFLTKFKKLAERYGTSDAWNRFIVSYACAISNFAELKHFKEREDLYNKQITSQDELKSFSELAGILSLAMLNNPYQDFLGSVYQKLNLNDMVSGTIFTPYHISHLMAEMMMMGKDCNSEIASKGYISVCDPCCGSGVMLLAGAEVLQKQGFNCGTEVLLVGKDINPTVALMCYIQLSILGYAGYVVIGNSLDNRSTDEDFWYTPAFCTDIWQKRYEGV